MGEAKSMHVLHNISQSLQDERDRQSLHFSRLLLCTISHELKTPMNSIIGENSIMQSYLEKYRLSCRDTPVVHQII